MDLYQGKAKIVAESGGGQRAIPLGSLVASERSLGDRGFRFPVAPGDYLVIAKFCGEVFREVRVASGEIVHVDFGCIIS